MKLQAIGKIIAMGYGNRVLAGLLVGFLNGITPGRAYEYIRDDLNLGYWVPEKDWERFRRMAGATNIGDITSEDIINQLRKSRPDILGVIINHPQGRRWLDKQVVELKKKLGIQLAKKKP